MRFDGVFGRGVVDVFRMIDVSNADGAADGCDVNV